MQIEILSEKHKDIDYSEQIEFMLGFEIVDQIVRDFLINKSLQGI